MAVEFVVGSVEENVTRGEEPRSTRHGPRGELMDQTVGSLRHGERTSAPCLATLTTTTTSSTIFLFLPVKLIQLSI